MKKFGERKKYLYTYIRASDKKIFDLLFLRSLTYWIKTPI